MCLKLNQLFLRIKDEYYAMKTTTTQCFHLVQTFIPKASHFSNQSLVNYWSSVNSSITSHQPSRPPAVSKPTQQNKDGAVPWRGDLQTAKKGPSNRRNWRLPQLVLRLGPTPYSHTCHPMCYHMLLDLLPHKTPHATSGATTLLLSH